MRNGWCVRPLGELLEAEAKTVEVTDGREYPIIGVLNYGRGLLTRSPVTSTDTSYRKLNRIGPDRLVYSKLKAFEGAITVTPSDLSDSYASQEFPTFSCRAGLSPAYLRLVTQQPSFWDALASSSKGVGGRRERLHPRDFLSLEILVPPLREQRRIANLMGVVADATSAAQSARTKAVALARSLRHEFFGSRDQATTVGELYEVSVGKQLQTQATEGDLHPYLRAGNIADGYLDLSTLKQMRLTSPEAGRLRLLDGDVVVVEGGNGYGKSAVWRDIGRPVAYQNHVLRLRPKHLDYPTGYAFQWTRWCHEQGRFKFTGTGIPNLGAAKVRAMGMPLRCAGDSAVLEALTNLDTIAALRGRALDVLLDLRANLLNALLSSQHEIPESYDELMEAQTLPA